MNKQEQIGGEHYQSEIQPVDYIAANNLDFFEGNVIKYVTRWRKKNGLEDLEKAAWYIKYLIDAEKKKKSEFKPKSKSKGLVDEIKI